MPKIEDLKKEVELLKSKIHQGDKTEDKNLLPKIRTWRKKMKRAQRRIRLLASKKTVIQEKGKTPPEKTEKT